MSNNESDPYIPPTAFERFFDDLKSTLFLIVICVIPILIFSLFSSCGNSSNIQPSSQSSGTNNTQYTTDSNYTDLNDETNSIVYVTDTGLKYHKANCGYLHESKHPISIKEARLAGYTPCAVCW